MNSLVLVEPRWEIKNYLCTVFDCFESEKENKHRR